MLRDDPTATTNHPSSSGRLTPTPPAVFAHLRALTNDIGLWEHALGSTHRPEHGFCTDDNARALVVVSRHAETSDGLDDLASTYLRFLLDAQTTTGRFHNRRSAEGAWIDDVGSDDSQGRALWGLGATARSASSEEAREAALEAFAACDTFSSPHLRANAYAALGAAEILVGDPDNGVALELLEKTITMISDAALGRIPWPENRLTYDNARLPEALIAGGALLGRRRQISLGTRLLDWLVGAETNGDHYSFTPTVGWEPGEPRPQFDQQPIEAWAMADACFRGWSVTGNDVWRLRAISASQWLMGRNDNGLALYDPTTGGTCDGLTEHSVNTNRGAESTLSGIGALQIAAACTSGGLEATDV